MIAMTDETVHRVGDGEWLTAACKEPVEAMVPVGDDLMVAVCAEHLRLFEGRSAVVA